ncbi:hypothetical protein SAMN04487999_1591 [Leeuwenhoekiella palythoae]|uniref:Uncharacterized protein n=1 Tax=Leeuwenhoekiella palythoae TaxID=573501 RepID=A0A1M5XM54_9FLAO|nr:hypothetical protein DSM01_885 [Leeuwenhoekiella palythoae]SHI00935.1 hypothetical protein SAMN04487999_1591 [Leeuwenhoekiella palythoae]
MLKHFGKLEKIQSLKDAIKKTAIVTSRFFYELNVLSNLA